MKNIEKVFIWIDPNIDDNENKYFLERIKNKGNYFIEIYTNNFLEYAINIINTIKFIPIILILSGKLYPIFIENYKNHLENYNVILEIIIFTSNKENYLMKNKNNEDLMLNDNFYNIGGIVDNEDDLMKALKPEKYFFSSKNNIVNPEKENNEEEEKESNFIFQSIISNEQFFFPIFYKNLFNMSDYKSNHEFLEYIIKEYSYDNQLQELIQPLLKFLNIPVKILYKFFLKLYLLQSKQINKTLKSENCYKFTSFIQVLYEALSLRLIEPFYSGKIYHASYINRKNFEKNCIIGNLIYIRQFVLFNKVKENVIKEFKSYKKKDYYNILYEIEEIDIDNINNEKLLCCNVDLSSYENNGEILVFPFSSFIISEIETKNENINYWIIHLKYLGEKKKDILKKYKAEQNFNSIINVNSQFLKEFDRFKCNNFSNEIINPLINYDLINNKNKIIMLDIDSKIIINHKEKNFILDCLKSFSNIKFNLLYRLTRDGKEFKTFHKKCDGFKNNLIVIESYKGKFGSFCPKEWKSDNNSKESCDNVFLFELNSFNKFYNKSKFMICYSKNLGPILSTDFCFKKENMEQFFCNGKGAFLTIENKQLFTNEKTDNIIIKEVEIFQIINDN